MRNGRVFFPASTGAISRHTVKSPSEFFCKTNDSLLSWYNSFKAQPGYLFQDNLLLLPLFPDSCGVSMERKGIKLILTAVDESPRSHRVVERALEMAETFQAKIILLHSRQKVPDFLGHPYYQKVLNAFMKKAELTTAPLKKLLEESGVEHEVLILEGDPAQAIIEAEQDEKCDLIVMGTRGLSDFKGMALGSVSHKVLNAAGCMVLIVP